MVVIFSICAIIRCGTMDTILLLVGDGRQSSLFFEERKCVRFFFKGTNLSRELQSRRRRQHIGGQVKAGTAFTRGATSAEHMSPD